jgi:hypothetical protein
MDAKAARTGRPIYAAMGVLALFIVFAGFFRTFYLKGWFAQEPLSVLVWAHGLVMSSWFSLFFIQTWLVASHRVDVHRKLGMAGAGVAALVLLIGFPTAVIATRLGHVPPGAPPIPFLTIPLFELLVFATLIGLGLALRRRPDTHRRLMLMGTLGVLPAALFRVPLGFIQRGGVPVVFGITDAILLVCLLYDTIRHRRLHPAMGWSFLFVAATHPFRLWLSGTEAWHRFATWLIS